MKKTLLAVSTAVLLYSAPAVHAEYSSSDDFTVQRLTVVDQDNQKLTTLNDNTESVYIRLLMKNPSWSGSEIMLAGIYDGTTDKMKFLKESASASIQPGYRDNVDIEITVDELAAAGAAPGDKIKIYVWDSTAGMQQMLSCITSDDFANYSTEYITNSVTDYNMHINEVRGDNWSYLCRYRDMTNTSALLSSSMTMCRQNSGNTNGVWYTDPTGKTNNWYLSPNGLIKTETARLLGYNYTIGELTEGQNLKVTGKLTGEENVILYVLKTNDSVESVSGFGKGAIGYSDDWMNDNVYKQYDKTSASEDMEFEFVIPAAEVGAGNDITFWVNRTGGSTSASNYLDVTIEVMDSEGIIESETEVSTESDVIEESEND